MHTQIKNHLFASSSCHRYMYEVEPVFIQISQVKDQSQMEEIGKWKSARVNCQRSS